MPLFMLISGYFFRYTVKKYNTCEIVKNRIGRLLLPIFTWSLVPVGLRVIKYILIDNTAAVDFKWYFTAVLPNLWFLWAVIFCSLIVLAVSHFFRDSGYVYLLLTFAMLLLPDYFQGHMYKYMFPYFAAGYLWNKLELADAVKRYFSRWVFILLILLFFILLQFYSYDSYIYTSKIYIFNGDWVRQLSTDIYRWLIGFIGSAAVLSAGCFIKDSRSYIIRGLRYIGRESLGVYIISGIIYANVAVRLLKHVNLGGQWVIPETALILAICMGCCEIINRAPLLRFLCLGKRK